MTIRTPMPSAAARILMRELAASGSSIKYTQALEIIAKVLGFQNYHALRAHRAAEGRNAPPLELAKNGRLRVHACNILIEIFAREREAYVALYPKGSEGGEARAETFLAYKEASDDKSSLREDLPFFGCALPVQVIAVEFVSSDSRAADWSLRVAAEYAMDDIVDWLEKGMPNDDYDVTEDIIDMVEEESLSVQDLLDASLDRDGLFELKDGREFYLIDERNRRWAPRVRVA